MRFALTAAFLLLLALVPPALSVNVGEDDYTSNFTTPTSGGGQSSATGMEGPWAVDQPAIGILQSGDMENRLGIMHLLEELPALPQLYITRVLWPNPIMADENETMYVNTTVRINQSETDVYVINVTDQVPWDFAAPQALDVDVYFIDYAPYAVTCITGNSTVNVSLLDQGGTLPTLLMVNISNISQTDAGTPMQENDSLLFVYEMVSSRMSAGDTRLIYTNATVRDNLSRTASGYILESITAFEAVLRGWKSITMPDPEDPQVLSVEIRIYALGGPLSDIYMADYLPQGAQISGLNVTYYNHSTSSEHTLYNATDYCVSDPVQDTLPDGTHIDLYYYNFSCNFTSWDGNLYDNDSITLRYNVTVLGGGQWILPALISGFDPQYRKHITTEMHAEASIPLFDVVVSMLTETVSPGGLAEAVLRMTNMGGPRAQVDVFLTYSVKTVDGGLVVERSDTFAVAGEKERGLSLRLPLSLSPGIYNFEALVTYTGREALSTDVFEVLGLAGLKEDSWTGALTPYLVIAALLIIIVVMYLRTGRKKPGS